MTAALLEPVTDIDASALVFEAGLPGFPEAHHFELQRWGSDDSPFSILRSLDVDGLEFVVVPPGVFFPDYEPEIDDATVVRLGISSPSDVILLVMLTLGDRPADATANLLGPIVVNRNTHRAAQAVLASSGYELRTPLI